MFFLTILFLLLLPHLLGPLLIRLTNKQPAYPDFTLIRHEDLPPQIAGAFARAKDVLAGLGFEQVACLYKFGLATNVRTYLMLLVNRETKDGALVYDMLADSGLSSIHRSIVEFCTELSNGVEVCTNTSNDPNPYKSYPEKLVYRFPEVRNPWALYNLHRQMVNRHAGAGIYSYLPSAGNEIPALSSGFTKTLMRQVEFGYLYLDEAAEVFRPTWKGAILMTWKLAWPVGMIQRALIRRNARRMMKQFRHALVY